MYKVFAFHQRNAALLSHDAYRAAHVGHHASAARRLRGLRGYCIGVRSEIDPRVWLGPLYEAITWREPTAFVASWDGLSALHFDTRQSWAGAAEPEPTRATAAGLAVDPDWNPAGDPNLFAPVPGFPGSLRSHFLRVEEHPILPVVRPERRLTKLLQFFRRTPAMPDDAFRLAVTSRYAYLASRMRGLHGYTVNFGDPDRDAAVRDVLPSTDWRLTEAGRAERRAFCSMWDGASELYFDTRAAFVAARTDPALYPELCALERHLFEAVWYVEVDENLVVMPNRDPAPDFYYR